MSAATESFRAVLISLWLRLMTVGTVALLFALTMTLSEKISSWRFSLTTGEIVFELAVRVVSVAVAGMTLGTVCTVAIAPFLLYLGSSRPRFAEVAVGVAVVAAAFGDFALVLRALDVWAHLYRFTMIFACYCGGFAVVLLVPRWRKQLMTSLDGFLGEKAARRNAIAICAAFAALVATEWTMGKTASTVVMAGGASRPSGPNVLLVTFDALSAEDMSLYGYRLPTTPNIDEFARKSSVFSNFYSASTFTTPSVATILTGLHPSESRVYYLMNVLPRDAGWKSLPHLMRAGGYTTGASISSPFAYSLAEGIAGEFDHLAELCYRTGGLLHLWNGLRILHQREPFGSRAEEFYDLENIWDFVPSHLESYNPRLFGRTRSEFPPAGSFAQAREVIDQLPDGFFLWVHVMAPHQPYLPDPPNLRRFLPSNEMRTEDEQSPLHGFWPHYVPGLQNRVDKARLRYDEFIADADKAFGAFVSGLEGAGRLRNTAVIVAADHGESFEGGVYTHGDSVQTRPEIHIPLIIRMPGQEQGHRVAVAADQAALAPTVLDIAGLPRPDWMPGRSLLSWLTRDDEGEGQGLAFTQHLSSSSLFKPLNVGTVGVIDGRHQYVLDLATGKGILRPLSEAHLLNRDHSAEDPALAETLRRAIYSRFPDLPRKSQ